MNTLRGECKDFVARYGNDGDNNTAQSRYQCYYNKVSVCLLAQANEFKQACESCGRPIELLWLARRHAHFISLKSTTDLLVYIIIYVDYLYLINFFFYVCVCD